MANIYVRSTDGSDGDSGATWALAKATVTGALAIAVAGDTIWVSQAHAANPGAAITWTFPGTPVVNPVRILCGNDSAEPPISLATTGFETTGGNFAFTTVGFGYVEGMGIRTGNAGAGAAASIVLGGSTTPSGQYFKNCAFFLNNTSVTGVNLGQAAAATNDDNQIVLDSCSHRCGAIGQAIILRHGRQHIKNLSLDASGSTPTNLFFINPGTQADALIEDSDLTGRLFTNLLSWGSGSPNTVIVRNCKVPAGINPTNGTNPGPGGTRLLMDRCANGDIQSYTYEADWTGVNEYTSAIYLNAGATDADGTHYSSRMTANANTSLYHPLRGRESFFYVTTIGSPVTLGVEVAVDGASVTLQNDDAYIEVSALTTSGGTAGALQSSRVPSVIATPTNLPTSSATWTGLGGTNSKFRISITFTPQERGMYSWRVCVAEASRVLHVDPTLS